MTVQLATGGGGAPAGAGAGAPRAFFLSSNVFLPVGATPGATRVTAGPDGAPTARTTFVVLREGAGAAEACAPAHAAGGGAGDVVAFGDRVVLAASPALVADAETRVAGMPPVLFSQKANIALGNTRKGMQEVTLAPAAGRAADAAWVVRSAGGDDLTTVGEPVALGEDVVLEHAMSRVPLSATPAETFPTDFGAELEVHAASHKGAAHAGMNAEGALPPAPAAAANRWRFLAGAAPARDGRGISPLTPAALAVRARGAIARALGPHGLRSLALALQTLDPRGSGYAPRESVRLALFDHGAVLSDEEAAALFSPFAAAAAAAGAASGLGRGPGAALLPRAALLAGLRGDTFTPRRAAAAAAAYAELAAAGAPVTAGRLKAAFDGKFDPRVLAAGAPGAPRAGGMTAVEAASEFARQWPSHPKAADAVSAADFAAYYADVAACVDDDDEFEAMVANVWHLAGKGFWKPKGGLRVHIDFFNGSATDATVADEGFAHDDFDALIDACAKIGMGGIARVKVVGVVE